MLVETTVSHASVKDAQDALARLKNITDSFSVTQSWASLTDENLTTENQSLEEKC
jgi:hypothetical protein